MSIKDLVKIFEKIQGGQILTNNEYDQVKNYLGNRGLKDFLSNITFEDIEDKRELFRLINFSSLDEHSLFRVISDTFSFNINGISMSMLMPMFSYYKRNTIFYRIRKVVNNDCVFPIITLQVEQDVWNPPAQFVTKLGRLNKIGEPLLYTCPESPIPAVLETRIPEGERFCLIEYEAIKDVKVVNIGVWKSNPDLSEEENLKMRMMMNLLGDLFSRDVGDGTEFLYRLSERIAKDYFDLPLEVQDGWCYPSVAFKLFLNVCFRPEIAKSVLRVKDILIGTYKKIGDDFLFNFPIKANWDKDKNQFVFRFFMDDYE